MNKVRQSALPPKADMAECDRHVRFVPKADSSATTRQFVPSGFYFAVESCFSVNV
jgi:hypothetical protein